MYSTASTSSSNWSKSFPDRLLHVGEVDRAACQDLDPLLLVLREVALLNRRRPSRWLPAEVLRRSRPCRFSGLLRGHKATQALIHTATALAACLIKGLLQLGILQVPQSWPPLIALGIGDLFHGDVGQEGRQPLACSRTESRR